MKINKLLNVERKLPALNKKGMNKNYCKIVMSLIKEISEVNEQEASKLI
jgi:hypothetical protein